MEEKVECSNTVLNNKKRKVEEKEEKEEEVQMDGFCFSEEPTLEKIRQMQAKFADDRNWNQFHSPRNLLLALVGEVGELAEVFQWKGEVEQGLPGWSDGEKEHLGEELSDVLIYLVRLADKCNIDLPSAVTRKFGLNAKKYPPSLVSGCSKKYTEYDKSTIAEHTEHETGEARQYKEVNGKLTI